MKSDSEASVMAVKRTIAEWRSAPTPMLETPVRESMCNGKMEQAVRTVQGQLRTLKFALEANIGVNIEATPKNAWLCSWACTTINRYNVGTYGRTAFCITTGEQCSRSTAEIGLGRACAIHTLRAWHPPASLTFINGCTSLLAPPSGRSGPALLEKP